MIASLSSIKRTLLCKWIDAAKYEPLGKMISPPPLVLHFSIARLIAAVSLSRPFPVAPKSRTLKLVALNRGSGKFGGVHGSGAAARARIDKMQPRTVVETQLRIGVIRHQSRGRL